MMVTTGIFSGGIARRPCRRRGFAAGVALLLALAAGPFASAQASSQRPVVAPQEFDLRYVVYIGGISAVNMGFDATLAPDRYQMKMTLDGRNILRWWFSWTMSAFSEGRIVDDRVLPVKAGANSTWKGKERLIRMAYDDPARPPETRTVPPPSEEDRTPVAEEAKIGTTDLTAAVLDLLLHAGKTGKCDQKRRVFDGRRLFNIGVDRGKKVVLPETSYAAWHGKALKCRLVLEPIAGYKRDRDSSAWRSEGDTWVWLAAPMPGMPLVPVRMEADLALGSLIIHLSGGKQKIAGVVNRLKDTD